ncbi:MAG: Gfo/Idh/MocA family protein [Armatimonadota bacterium]
MDKVRVGFVGVGGMGQCAHLRNYVTVPDCEVAAISEIREKQGKMVAARYGIPKVYTDYNEMIAKENLDCLVASQPFTRHGILIPELLKYGLPVFTEKPLAGSIEMGEKVVQAVKDNNTWMMIGYHKRSDPASMYAKAEIDRLKASGELGPMKYVRITMPVGDWVANGFLDMIVSDDPIASLEFEPAASDMDKETFEQYVSFVNYYIHQVNLMRYFLGEDYKVTFADKSGVLLTTESDSGVTGVIEMNPYQTSIDWQESALVAFANGYIRVDLPAPLASNRPGKVEMLRDPGTNPQTIIPHLPWIHAMRQQAMNFVAAVKGERPTMCTAEDALKDLLVAREYIRLWKGK